MSTSIMDCYECKWGVPIHIMLMRKCFLAILMLLNLNTDYANADADLCPWVVILNMIWQTQCLPSYYNLLQWWTSGMILKQCSKRETGISLISMLKIDLLVLVLFLHVGNMTTNKVSRCCPFCRFCLASFHDLPPLHFISSPT